MFNTFFSEICTVYEIMWTGMVRGRQATDDNTVHKLYMLDNLGHGIRNRPFCFSTNTVVLRMRPGVNDMRTKIAAYYDSNSVLCEVRAETKEAAENQTSSMMDFNRQVRR
jgi:hypothetical protein